MTVVYLRTIYPSIGNEKSFVSIVRTYVTMMSNRITNLNRVSITPISASISTGSRNLIFSQPNLDPFWRNESIDANAGLKQSTAVASTRENKRRRGVTLRLRVAEVGVPVGKQNYEKPNILRLRRKRRDDALYARNVRRERLSPRDETRSIGTGGGWG